MERKAPRYKLRDFITRYDVRNNFVRVRDCGKFISDHCIYNSLIRARGEGDRSDTHGTVNVRRRKEGSES